MTSPVLPPALEPIVRYLDNLTERAPLDELRTRLRDSRVSLRDLREWMHFDAEHYRRNLVSRGKWYDLLVICWRSGQRSPIHDHAGSSCAFKVMTGICSETVYGFGPCGQVYPLHTLDQAEGAIVATQDSDTHQVSNLQPHDQDLVTLHIYSPPLSAMHAFSLLGEDVRLLQATGAQEAAELNCGEAI